MSTSSNLISGVTGIVVGALGMLGAIATGGFDYLNKDRGQDIQMVNIALSILGGENQDSSVPGRKFALRLLEEYGDVDIPDAEFETWAMTGTLPDKIYKGLPSFYDYSGVPREGALVEGLLREYTDRDNSREPASDRDVMKK